MFKSKKTLLICTAFAALPVLAPAQSVSVSIPKPPVQEKTVLTERGDSNANADTSEGVSYPKEVRSTPKTPVQSHDAVVRALPSAVIAPKSAETPRLSKGNTP